jgi:small subunit ribosomal protein S11e
MATELTVQSERAFQKQPHIFTAQKTRAAKRRVGKGGRRWYKDVGLGFKTPKTAIEGSYIGLSLEVLLLFGEEDGDGGGGGAWNCD